MGDKTMNSEINITELLLQISSDVSSIKTEMAHFQKEQIESKKSIDKEFADVRADYKRDLSELENKLTSKINNMQTVQNTLVGDVDTLKHADEKKDAKRWQTIMAFVGTAIGGLVLGKLPDILKVFLTVGGN